MKKTLLYLLTTGMILTGPNIYANNPESRLTAFDEYKFRKEFKAYKFGEEKLDNSNIDHFLFSALGNTALTGLYNKLEIKHAKTWSALTILLLGIGKEVIDGYRVNDKFSWNDLISDGVGISLTFPFLLNKKQIQEDSKNKMIYEMMKELEKRELLNEKYKKYLTKEEK